MRGLYETIKDRFAVIGRRRQLIRTAEDLRAFLEGEAAHVAQSAVYDYLRARAGRFAPQLFREAPFLQALEVTRWEAFAAVLLDVAVIALTELRPHVTDSAALAERLTDLCRATLGRHPAPAHRTDGWNSYDVELAQRLAAACASPRQTPDAIAGHSGATIFKHLPLHPDVRRLDEEMVVNNVRFRILRSWETFKERVDLPEVAADLMTSGAKPS